MSTRAGAAAVAAAVALVGVAGLAGAVPAAAVTGGDTGGGISVSPVRIERDVDSGSVRARVWVRNEGREPTTVRVRTAGLGHDLEGIPQFRPGDAHAEALTIQPSRLELGGGQRAAISLAGQLPDQGLYVAVLVEADPSPAPRGGITARTRVATLVMVRGPRPWDQRVAIEALALRERADDAATLTVEVANQGAVHVRPHGHAVVADAGGNELARVDLAGERVLPGYARRLTAAVELPTGADGPFTVRTVLSDPDAEARHTVELQAAANEADATPPPEADVTRTGAGPGPTRVEGAADAAPAPLLALAGGLLMTVSLALAWTVARQRQAVPRGG